jgi:hypothetical protein
MAASTKLGIMLSGSNRHTADDFGGVDSPKLKFNFGITFKFSDMIVGAEEGDWDRNTNVFAVKQISRPAPNVLYEDVNYYNHMTKVATKVDFAIVTVTMYDDKNNLAHRIFSKYLESISPITRKEHPSTRSFIHKWGRTVGSNMGPHTDDGRNSPIHAINVYQYLDKDKMVIYHYLNPKIQNVALDELDMTQSDVNTLTFNFMYDSVYVEEVGDFGSVSGRTEVDVIRDRLSQSAVDSIERLNSGGLTEAQAREQQILLDDQIIQIEQRGDERRGGG